MNYFLVVNNLLKLTLINKIELNYIRIMEGFLKGGSKC